MESLANLQNIIGYKFSDISILKTALTHKSCGRNNYEKLEFLGDSILSFCISRMLFAHHHYLNEGEMSIVRAKIVNKQNLSAIGKRLNIDPFIRCDKNQKVSEAIRADVIESLIAAVYLDSDLDTCYQIAETYFKPILSMIDKKNLKDAKSLLQEAAHAYKYQAPIYKIAATEGKPHEKVYTIICYMGDYSATGIAASKRQAEMIAAQDILKQMEKVIL